MPSLHRVVASICLGCSIPGAVACSALLGIETLPLRDGGDGGEPTPVTATEESGADCGSGPTFCERQCPAADFCDDFENETPAFERWRGGANIPSNIVTASGAATLLADEGGTKGTIFSAIAFSDTRSPAATVLGHVLEAPAGRVPRGLRLRLEARLGNLTFGLEDAVPRSNYLYFVVVGDPLTNEGVALVLSKAGPSQVELIVQQREIASRGAQIDLVHLVDLDTATLQANWFGFELIFGTAALFKELKIPCNLVDVDRNPIADAAEVDGAPPDGLRVVAKFGTDSRCVPLHDALATGTWLSKAALVTGATVSDLGNATIYVNDFVVTYLW